MTIVDAGTGNGIWALEIASENADCQIIGLDLRPPSEQSLSNLKFQEADITKQWPLSSDSVD
jgi:methylase of polypeptide subunit release factors